MVIDNRATNTTSNSLNRGTNTRLPNGLVTSINMERNLKDVPVGVGPFNRSLTLNRLDMQRHRQQQRHRASARGHSLQRNLSALGHYPIKNNTHQQIYAPASIASPNEYKPSTPMVNNYNESQHYAATSFCAQSVAGESTSRASGRESALGNLLERIGTFRRKAKWRASSTTSKKAGNLSNNETNITRLPLDPEIYSSGKKKVEAEDIYAEGQLAIDGNQVKRTLELDLLADETLMNEGETLTTIEPESKNQSDYCELVENLTNWINDELAHQRIIVRDLQEDLYDGQILGKLIEKLHNVTLDIVEVTQNEITQRYKLRTVLNTINRILSIQARWARIRWTVEGIHGKNLVEILHLLVTLAICYQAPFKLPPNVTVRVLVIRKHRGQLVRQSLEAKLTDISQQGPISLNYDQVDSKQQSTAGQRDAFDTLCEHAPEKLVVVKQSLVNFVNRHLNKINMSCFTNAAQQQLEPDQFSDGLLLVFLISSLEDYFVPLGNLFTSPVNPKFLDTNNNTGTINGFIKTAIEPTSYINTQPIHKLHNVNVAFQLLEEAGINIRSRVRAEDVVNGDLKAVLRVLYAIFSRYKHL